MNLVNIIITILLYVTILLIPIALICFITYLVVKIKNTKNKKSDSYKTEIINEQYNSFINSKEAKKGKRGEEKISKEIFLYNKKLGKRYKFYKNTFVPKKDSSTAEIDIILITDKFIYVIESKNYNGYIHGKDTEKNWKQYIKKGCSYDFYNPVWQNYGHIKSLMEYLEINDKSRFKSIIVFGNNSKLSKIFYNKKNCTICLLSEFQNELEIIENSADIQHFTKDELDYIYNKIGLLKKYVDKKIKAEHNIYVQKIK